MIVIAEPYARFKETLEESELETAATYLLKVGEEVCRQYFEQRYDQLGITIETSVEVGSTKTWVIVKGFLAVLIFYGGVRTGIDYLIKDSETVNRLILPMVASTIGLHSAQPERQERRYGLPGELRRLFERLKRGGLSYEEAESRALRLLEGSDDPSTAREMPNIRQKLIEEMKEVAANVPSIKPLQMRDKRVSVREETEKKRLEKQELPRLPDIVALPPRRPIRRRRVVAVRDPRTGEIKTRSY